MIKAIVFDMNGIIFDDEHIHELAFKETLIPFDIDLNHQMYRECCAGRTDQAGYEQLAIKFFKDLPIQDVLRQKSLRYLQLFPEHKKTYLGVIELIHSLAKHFSLALTSSSLRVEVNLVLKEFGIENDFIVTVSADDVSKGKPDPEPYLLTVQKLGFKSEETVVIEDSASGVASAKSAGCFCIGVTTTHTHSDLMAADQVIDDFSIITKEFIQSIAEVKQA